VTSEAPPKWCAPLPAGIRSRSWSGHSSPGVPLARVKILIVSPRMPTPGGKGDQIRAFQFAQALAPQHSVQVLTTGAGVDSSQDVSALADIRVSDASPLSRALGGLGALLRGQPVQVGWMMPQRGWREVRRLSADCDVVLAITVRAVRGPLPALLVIDHIDAISVNMRRRATGPEAAPVRWAARIEAALLERWERRLRRYAAAQIAISPLDAALLPSPPEVHVVHNYVEVPAEPAGGTERDIDVILTGNMSYPPNRDAAQWLSDSIAPELLARRPDTSICVVGRRAGELEFDPRIEVHTDVPALDPFLRRSKIALAPLRLGTGNATKVLEAMVAGAAVVATPAAVESFGFPATAVETADTAEGLASAIESLLADSSARSGLVARSFELVRSYGPEAQRERLEAILASVAGASKRV
jgi:glycosyltransferase involved in cell wall biosynthesis